MTDQELINAMVARYIQSYNHFAQKGIDLCGFVDAHDAAYSSLSYVIQEAADEAMAQISKAK